MECQTLSTKMRAEQMGESYLKLAEKHNWTNPDGSYLPINLKNLCKFIEYKGSTNIKESIKWYLQFLGKYQLNKNAIRDLKNWKLLCEHKHVQFLLKHRTNKYPRQYKRIDFVDKVYHKIFDKGRRKRIPVYKHKNQYVRRKELDAVKIQNTCGFFPCFNPLE
ncbi:13216_t:CDS:2 [Ambispora leptoticha]|uniref:13216_t:CDS:1 n=1 Tax=Ambispora leptoticha TaxID=144679 RepID=A0A9N9C4L8_9GLOM|nr:13216_t:CDS:2 [Ambispora leptoticha]